MPPVWVIPCATGRLRPISATEGGTHDVLSTRLANGSMTEPELAVLACTGCGARWLSPAGARLVEMEDACLHCGGPLVFDDQDDSISTVRRAWSTLLAHDVDGIFDQHDPEVEIQPAATHLDESVEPVYRGHEGLRRWMDDCSGRWKMVPNELQTHGDHVLTRGRLVQRGKEDANYAVAWISRVRRGKVVSFKGYLNPSEALHDLQVEAAD